MGSSKSHETIRRHWMILQRISRKTWKGTRELQISLQQAGVDVSLRTIQRDLIELSAHFPLERDDDGKPDPKPAPHIGWRWAEDAPALEIPGMDPFAALTLKMVNLHLGQMLPEGCLTFLKPHLKKAGEVLQGLKGEGVAGWPQKIGRVSRYLTREAPPVDTRVLRAVYDGLLSDRQLEVVYRKKGSEEGGTYRTNPLGLVFVDTTIYLVGCFEESPKVYKFALHRITSATCLEAACSRPDGFDLQDYIDQGNFEFPKSEGQVQLRTLLDKAVALHLEEAPLSSDQTLVTQADGRVLLTATVHHTLQLQWWILGLGDRVEVIAPTELRSQIAEVCRNLNNTYSRKESR